MRRVAITGIGLLSAIGVGREAVWRNLVAGRSGIRQLTLFNPAGYRSLLAAEVADYEPERRFSLLEQRRWNNISRASRRLRRARGEPG